MNHYKNLFGCLRCCPILTIYLTLTTWCAHTQTVTNRENVLRPFLIAHRGNHEKAPENSLAALEAAIVAGVDFAEIDVRQTRDGIHILMHDASIQRTTNGRGKVKNLTFKAIRAFSLKSSSETFADPVPELTEALRYCKGKIKIYLDFKSGSPEDIIKDIRQTGMENDLIVYLNDPKQINIWKKLAPELPLLVSLPDRIQDAEGIKHFLRTYPADALDGNWKSYTTEMIQYCKHENIPLWVDIQSESENDAYWANILRYEFDALQTDHPEQLIRYLEDRP